MRSGVEAESISGCCFFPFSGNKILSALTAILHQTFTFLCRKNISLHNAGTDTADANLLEIKRMIHYVNKPDFVAIAEIAFCESRRCILIITFAHID